MNAASPGGAWTLITAALIVLFLPAHPAHADYWTEMYERGTRQLEEIHRQGAVQYLESQQHQSYDFQVDDNFDELPRTPASPAPQDAHRGAPQETATPQCPPGRRWQPDLLGLGRCE